MKVFLDWLRLVFVSGETVIFLLSLVLAAFFPSLFQSLGEKLKSNGDATKAIMALPIGILVGNFTLSKDLLFPGDEDTKKLKGWSGYSMLWNRVLFANLVCVVASIGSFWLWLFIASIPPLKITLGAIFVTAVPSVSLVSVALASLTLKRILTALE